MKAFGLTTTALMAVLGVWSNTAAAAENTDGIIPSTVTGTYTIGPDYTRDPATYPCEDCEHGTTFHLEMPIEGTSYNCDPIDNPSLQNLSNKSICSEGMYCNCADGYCGNYGEPLDTRNVTVYIPAAYTDGEETGLLVMQDGVIPAGLYNTTSFDAISHVMDRFIGSDNEERSLPTFVQLGLDLAGPGVAGGICGNSDGTERFNEYATVSDQYAKFVNDEVLPFVLSHPDITSKYPNLTITNDPTGRAAIGTSDGGGASIKMAFFTPELFGIAIGYNAGVVNHYDDALTSKKEYPLDLGDLWAGKELIKNEDKKPIRIFHSGCERDLGTPNGCVMYEGPDNMKPANASDVASFGKPYDFLVANNKTEESLTSKGYDTRYAYGLDCCHSDDRMFFQDIPNTLVWAFTDWKKKTQNTNLDEPPNKSTLPPTSSSTTWSPGVIDVVLTIALLFVL